MEWALLVALALAAALAIAAPAARGGQRAAPDAGADELRAARTRLLAELRELNDDARSGRIAPADRALGRRAIAPQLRAVTEALRAAGVEPRS